LIDLGRLQGVGNQDLERLVPAHDVDPLAPELIHDILDSRPADPDARANGVDLGVDRSDGDLGPVSRLARQRPDGDDLVGDLGDLQLEQTTYEVGMSAAEDDLDALTDLAHVQDDGADPFVGVVAFPGNLLAAGQDAVGLAQVDDNRATLEPLHRPGDEVGTLVLEFVEEAVALGLADLLDDHLLGCLRRDSPQLRGIHLDPVLGGVDGTGLAIDVNLNIGGIRIVLAGCGRERRLNPVEQDILGDILVSVNTVHDPDQINAYSMPPRRARSSRRGSVFLSAMPSSRATPPGPFPGRIGRTARSSAGTEPSPIPAGTDKANRQPQLIS